MDGHQLHPRRRNRRAVLRGSGCPVCQRAGTTMKQPIWHLPATAALLFVLVVLPTEPARAGPGFNCAKATRQIDKAICDWDRSEEHTSELQSLMRISYAVFCLKKKKKYTPVTYQ